jgi:hypothetical protein
MTALTGAELIGGEQLGVTSQTTSGAIAQLAGVVPGVFTFATLPSAATWGYYVARTTDQGAVFSNGSSWSVIGATGLTLTPSSTSAATANTNVIQAALTAGGVVSIPQPGTYYINSALVYASNTLLILGQNTVIRMAPGINTALLKSTAQVNQAAGGTTVTLTQNTGCSVNVLWANHGLVADQGVWLSGANQSGYNGVFRIAAVVDANNFTIYTEKYQATAPSGTIIAVVAVQNFSLVGGEWNYDSANNNATGLNGTAILAYGLIDSYFEGVYAYSAATNGITFGAVHNVNTKNLSFNVIPGSGVKVYGPARSMTIDGVSGVAAGDWISVQTKDVTAANQIGYGDIFDIHIRSIVGFSTANNFLHLYPSDNEDFDMVTVEDVNGQVGGIVVGTNSGSGYTVGKMGKIIFKKMNVTPNGQYGAAFTLTQAYTIDDLVVEDVIFNPAETVISWGQVFFASSGNIGTVNNFIVNRLRCGGYPASGTGTAAVCAFAGGTFNKMIFRDCEVVNGSVASGIDMIKFSSSYALGELSIENCFMDANTRYAVNVSAAPSAAPYIKFLNNRFLGAGCLAVAGTLNYTVKFGNGNTFSGQASGTVRVSNTGNTTIQSDGTNTFVTGSVVVTSGGAPTVTLFGWDIPYDVSLAALLQTTSAQYCVSTTAGTNKQGLAVKVNTASTATWYALGTNAGANTQIV